jgi:hypothetical protein
MSRLSQLINITHKHGVQLAKEIRDLSRRKAALERLNAKRRAQLHPRAVTMFDSVDVGTIPRDAEAVAGYVGGMWPTFPRLVSQFPHAHRLSIAVNAGEDAECLDIETGDATPAQGPAWVRRQKRRGIHRPVVYANLSTMPAVKAELLRAGILLKEVRLWVAHYTGVPHIPAGFDACQWTDRAFNRNLDQSLCSSNFF